ncbi:MAG: amidohydrolase, partial [Bacteroidetes bacterium]|nr:amidohydrolase [Bacteroidota bacterium]
MLNENILRQLTKIRKKLHANPEISEEEYETQKEIITFLSKETNAEIQKVANTGVLATFKSGKEGPTVLIRGDIDALPISEINEFEHRSMNPGVSHKCGHDGHTAILLGLAFLLSKEAPTKGTVLLLFQPAEENGMGAKGVLADPTFQNVKLDFAFALHNLPGFDRHEIVVKEQEFTGNVKSIIIQLNGKTSHAAEPEKGINPSLAIAELLQYADEITLNEPADKNFFLVTPVHLNMGDLAYGISAGYGELHFTIRSWSTELMATKCDALVQFIQQTCAAHQLKAGISWTQEFSANINHPEAVQHIRNASEKENYKLTETKYPFKWGEDFGLFTQQ